MGWSITQAVFDFESGPRQFRSTLLFHLERDAWRIVHEHWSYAASEEVYGLAVGSTLDLLSQAAAAERPDLSDWASADGTTTLMFTDIEGSTALTASFGDRAWMEVLLRHNDIVIGATTRHGGTVVKNQGDGFMLAFPSARRALACALAIDSEIRQVFDDPGSPIRVRIGVHTGEPISDADDFFGHAVNYTARVAGTALGGEIVVWSLVHDLVQPTGAFSFAAARDVELKGIAGTAQIFPLEQPG